MTSELEQEFFEVFGIEPKHNDGCKLADNYWYNDFLRSQYDTLDEYLAFNCPYQNDQCLSTCDFAYDDEQYPDITAEKLLVLLCIVIDEYNRNGRTFYLDSTNVKELKEEILDALMGCIDATCDLFESEVKQIQQLFEVEE